MWPFKKKPEKRPETYPPGTKTITIAVIGSSSLTCVIESCDGVDGNGFLVFTEIDGTKTSIKNSFLVGWTVKDW